MSTPAPCARSSASAARAAAFSAASRRRHVARSTACTRVPSASSLRATSFAKRAPASSRPEASASPPRKVTRNVFFPIHATCHGAPKPAATNRGVSALIERSSATPVKTTTPARVGVSGCAPRSRKTPASDICKGIAPSALAKGHAPRRPTKPRGGNAPPSFFVATNASLPVLGEHAPFSANTRTTPSPSTGTTDRACYTLEKFLRETDGSLDAARAAFDERFGCPYYDTKLLAQTFLDAYAAAGSLRAPGSARAEDNLANTVPPLDTALGPLYETLTECALPRMMAKENEAAGAAPAASSRAWPTRGASATSCSGSRAAPTSSSCASF